VPPRRFATLDQWDAPGKQHATNSRPDRSPRNQPQLEDVDQPARRAGARCRAARGGTGDHSATACMRLWAGYDSSTIASELGTSAAAPAACTGARRQEIQGGSHRAQRGSQREKGRAQRRNTRRGRADLQADRPTRNAAKTLVVGRFRIPLSACRKPRPRSVGRTRGSAMFHDSGVHKCNDVQPARRPRAPRPEVDTRTVASRRHRTGPRAGLAVGASTITMPWGHSGEPRSVQRRARERRYGRFSVQFWTRARWLLGASTELRQVAITSKLAVAVAPSPAAAGPETHARLPLREASQSKPRGSFLESGVR